MKGKAGQGAARAAPAQWAKETAVPSHLYRRLSLRSTRGPLCPASLGAGATQHAASLGSCSSGRAGGGRKTIRQGMQHMQHIACSTCVCSSTAGFKLPAVLSYRRLRTNLTCG